MLMSRSSAVRRSHAVFLLNACRMCCRPGHQQGVTGIAAGLAATRRKQRTGGVRPTVRRGLIDVPFQDVGAVLQAPLAVFAHVGVQVATTANALRRDACFRRLQLSNHITFGLRAVLTRETNEHVAGAVQRPRQRLLIVRNELAEIRRRTFEQAVGHRRVRVVRRAQQREVCAVDAAAVGRQHIGDVLFCQQPTHCCCPA